jgi:oxygen-independent coproporphyrinogen III oxidase
MQNKHNPIRKDLSPARPVPQNATPAGLYIHVPFCISKCPYCGFYSITDLSLVPDYLSALGREMALVKNRTKTFDTLYIGGGTPSVLSPKQIEKLLLDVRNVFNISKDAEITIEMNPADINKDRLHAVHEAGVNRISIGIQSFNDAILSFLGRRHTSATAAEAITAVRNAGFKDISIDLIYGIPRQRIEAWTETLQRAVAFRPEHISCYQLTIEKGTPLAQDCENGLVALPGESLQAQFFFLTAETLQRQGYEQYEVSNFSVTGRESRHNQKYWHHVPYLGLGPSAHSFSDRQRRWNVRSVHSYAERLTEGKLPVEEIEFLDSEKMRMEILFLGFRTRNGISVHDFKTLFDLDLLEEKKELIHALAKEGLATISNGFLRPTIKGMAVADSLALSFF